jgi:hypothetical protein
MSILNELRTEEGNDRRQKNRRERSRRKDYDQKQEGLP